MSHNLSMRLLVLTLIIGLIPVKAQAEAIKEIEGYIGLVSVNFAEIASNLEGPNVADPASGSFSVIAGSLAAHVFKYKKYSFYGGMTVPILVTQGVGYINGFMGGEYYFSDVAHMYHNSYPKLDIYLQPKMRYHANVELGVNFLTYSTDETKKSDISFGLGVGGGGSYAFSKNWAVKAKAIASKDFGLITDGLALKVFVGGIFFLDL